MLTPKTKSFFDPTFRYQLLATLTVHIMTLSHGIAIGWVSPTIKLLQSAETPLNFHVGIVEASWIGSVFGVGSLIGNIVSGLLLDRIGRKWCIYLLALPHMLLWILIFFAQSVEYLYVARVMAGITSGAIYVVFPIYLSEISDKSIRGALSSILSMLLSFGILFGFIMGSHLGYFVMPCVIIVFPIIYLIITCFFPETPQHLLRKGRIDAAEKSFKFYTNVKTDTYPTTLDEKVCLEFEELKDTFLKGTHGTAVNIKDFCNKHALHTFFTAFVLLAMNQFSASYAIVHYLSLIFAKSGSTMDANTCTIILGVVEILGTIIATTLVDHCGRKILLLTSAIGMAVFLIAFGSFTQFATPEQIIQLNWMPLVLISLLMLIASVGVVALVFTVVVEIMPAKIRSTATSICMAGMSVLIFFSLRFYPYLIDQYGLPTTMYTCSGVCIVSVIYLYYFLPETKGKSMDYDG